MVRAALSFLILLASFSGGAFARGHSGSVPQGIPIEMGDDLLVLAPGGTLWRAAREGDLDQSPVKLLDKVEKLAGRFVLRDGQLYILRPDTLGSLDAETFSGSDGDFADVAAQSARVVANHMSNLRPSPGVNRGDHIGPENFRVVDVSPEGLVVYKYKSRFPGFGTRDQISNENGGGRKRNFEPKSGQPDDGGRSRGRTYLARMVFDESMGTYGVVNPVRRPNSPVTGIRGLGATLVTRLSKEAAQLRRIPRRDQSRSENLPDAVFFLNNGYVQPVEKSMIVGTPSTPSLPFRADAVSSGDLILVPDSLRVNPVFLFATEDGPKLHPVSGLPESRAEIAKIAGRMIHETSGAVGLATARNGEGYHAVPVQLDGGFKVLDIEMIGGEKLILGRRGPQYSVVRVANLVGESYLVEEVKLPTASLDELKWSQETPRLSRVFFPDRCARTLARLPLE